MEWIKCSDRLPDDYDGMYAVLTIYDDASILRLNQKPFRIALAMWYQADMDLVKYHQDKGDHSWDWAEKDHWADCYLDDTKITHWVKLPNRPM